MAINAQKIGEIVCRNFRRKFRLLNICSDIPTFYCPHSLCRWIDRYRDWYFEVEKKISYICTLDSFSLPLTTEKQIFTSWRNFFQKFYSSRSIHVNTIFKILICLVIVIQRQLGSNGIFQYLTYFRIILNVIEPPKVRMIFLV